MIGCLVSKSLLYTLQLATFYSLSTYQCPLYSIVADIVSSGKSGPWRIVTNRIYFIKYWNAFYDYIPTMNQHNKTLYRLKLEIALTT